ncbi:MAG TPA: tRNA (guanosine(37)-N1)-methyltransferase TrmD [Fimbriimonadaceae bacterium]|nr:tRNA (guanosine(37)-N1)-methyltransferase TrmD [Fimbriimonadaceae bacterium]
MLHVGFVTLFPEMVLGACEHSILKRASERSLVRFRASNPRDFALDAHRTVDDRPYAGGPGMLMKPEPVAAAIRSLADDDAAIVVTDPTGEMFDQRMAGELSRRRSVVFVCGHYEGIDARVAAKLATHVLTIGDYVLTGGELAALVMADAVVRLVPGVLGDPASLQIDSHHDGLLSAPQFTRPSEWEGLQVPPELTQGDHGAAERWRRAQALQLTRTRRPDLLARAELEKRDVDLLSSFVRKEPGRP